MPMKNPPHPGRMLRDEIEALGLSVAKAADGLGVTRQQLHRVLSGTSAFSPEMAVRVARGIGGSAETWLKMQMNHDLARVERNGDAAKVRRLVETAA